jgi:hypothetical protein
MVPENKQVPVQTPKSRISLGMIGAVFFLAQGVSLFHYHYILLCRVCMGHRKVDPQTGVIWGGLTLSTVPVFLAIAWRAYRKMNRQGPGNSE